MKTRYLCRAKNYPNGGLVKTCGESESRETGEKPLHRTSKSLVPTIQSLDCAQRLNLFDPPTKRLVLKQIKNAISHQSKKKIWYHINSGKNPVTHEEQARGCRRVGGQRERGCNTQMDPDKKTRKPPILYVWIGPYIHFVPFRLVSTASAYCSGPARWLMWQRECCLRNPQFAKKWRSLQSLPNNYFRPALSGLWVT